MTLLIIQRLEQANHISQNERFYNIQQVKHGITKKKEITYLS